MNLVDPFFYIAGYLMYVLMIPQFNKRGTNWCHIPIVVVYKYARYVSIKMYTVIYHILVEVISITSKILNFDHLKIAGVDQKWINIE